MAYKNTGHTQYNQLVTNLLKQSVWWSTVLQLTAYMWYILPCFNLSFIFYSPVNSPD